ncbi:MAG: hypothetical protein ACJ79J_12450, partial [Gemmatimonadaceae bacterium]
MRQFKLAPAVLSMLSATVVASAQTVPTTNAQVVVTSGVKHAKVPFAVGEKMEYDVKFGVLRVGNAHMEV